VPHVDLSSGTIEYLDTGGAGPVLVFTHGLLMDQSVWSRLIPLLSEESRCIAPTFPVGSHRLPMHDSADLSQQGLADLLGEFLDVLDLRAVTLVVNDLGYPQALAADRHPRVSRLVLTPCEAFDNVPPGLPGRTVQLAARIPGGLRLAAKSLRVPGAARAPFTLGRMSVRPIPPDLLDAWTQPCRGDAAVRADLTKYIAGATATWQLETTSRLSRFDGPSLVVWSRYDKVMPPEHAQRLVQILPDARLEVVEDSHTLMSLDAPEALARHIREFLRAAGPTRPVQ
jgi:pimeloyl-ACP methyl ester carboxylesterase